MKLRRFRISIVLTLMVLMAAVSTSPADTVTIGKEKENDRQVFRLGSEQITCSVIFEENKLAADVMEMQHHMIKTDADFGVDVQWTGWLAPGKLHNAANPVMLNKSYFQLADMETRTNADGSKELIFIFNSPNYKNISLEIQLAYKLEPGAFYVKRRLGVRDPESKHHFLRWLWPRRSIIYGDISILKPGGFGQPPALLTNEAGAFFGMEYPAAENSLKPIGEKRTAIHTGQEMGMKIGTEWRCGEWSVTGLTPDTHVKYWFNKYLDTVRVAPLKPYLLYNTWYDVRSPEYTERPEDVMNETNLLRIINDFKREMKEKRGLKLDAFVLDDAWDIYKSDWVLREKEFPNGLKPIKEALQSMGTDLGIWFGPIGGYSHRNWRVDWMKAHGYEVVGDQLCLAGTNYRKLFKKRTTDFVRSDGVAYFKWDGIQFSCSEPDHGHPVGIYSRRAVMESVRELCEAVRAENPGIFLNITSGTWLSPWWMKYANQIWMQGRDYGYADVPSISRRDAAITYRDVVLYQNYGVNDSWFPISNLMTHGIIKGHLQKLGGETEPLDKFTDNAILYFARGVSMWELYVSPNLLTDGEWDAIAKSIGWAKHRFEVLKSTEMVGGDPGNREAYGYVHFSKEKAIIAIRNPFIEPQTVKVKLDPAHGLCPDASSLVLERVYPDRWVSPRLYAAGAVVKLPLQGYETAIYEMYPLEQATEPLLAGVTFDVVKEKGKDYVIRVHEVGPRVRLLNPEMVRTLKVEDRVVPLFQPALPQKPLPIPVKPDTALMTAKGNRVEVAFQFNEVNQQLPSAALCFLVEPGAAVSLSLDGRKVEAEVEQQEGRWAWYKIAFRPSLGQHRARLHFRNPGKGKKWKRNISAWMIYTLKPKGIEVWFNLDHDLPYRRPMPPFPRPAGEKKGIVKLAEVGI